MESGTALSPLSLLYSLQFVRRRYAGSLVGCLVRAFACPGLLAGGQHWRKKRPAGAHTFPTSDTAHGRGHGRTAVSRSEALLRLCHSAELSQYIYYVACIYRLPYEACDVSKHSFSLVMHYAYSRIHARFTMHHTFT